MLVLTCSLRFIVFNPVASTHALLCSLEDGTVIYSDSTDPSFDALDKAGPPQLPGAIYSLTPGNVAKVLIDQYDLIDPSIGTQLLTIKCTASTRADSCSAQAS